VSQNLTAIHEIQLYPLQQNNSGIGTLTTNNRKSFLRSATVKITLQWTEVYQFELYGNSLYVYNNLSFQMAASVTTVHGSDQTDSYISQYILNK
jgi:hypothetical protein